MKSVKHRYFRPVLAAVILAATIFVFTDYFITHAPVRQQLSQTSTAVILALLGLFLAMLASLALITTATLKICSITIPTRESLVLTAYSSLINFFGPLQSGPAFRGIYLKEKHGISLKQYTGATLLYYLFYGLFSGLFLLYGLLHWWTVALAALLILLGWLIGRSGKSPLPIPQFKAAGWYTLIAATFLQVSIFTIIYYLELHSVSPGVHFSQAVVYTGAANLALFVSITPGAIGFRESFLVFSQRLHHISNSTIVAANILDRAAYIIVLLLVAIVVFGMHLQKDLVGNDKKLT